MTNTTADTATDDRVTYDTWKLQQFEAYQATGCTNWFSSSKALRMRRRGSSAPRDAFTGPLWAAKPWMTQEAIDWFEVDNHPRYTFTDWQRLRREQRAAAAEYESAGVLDPLDTLAYAAELMARRGALIAEAREGGASWAQIAAASGLSRMQAHTLAKNATMAAVSAAVAAELAECGEVAF